MTSSLTRPLAVVKDTVTAEQNRKLNEPGLAKK